MNETNIGKQTNLGRIIFENDRCAVCVEERPNKLFIAVLPKVKGVIHYPLGIVLGSNGLDFYYPKDSK